MSFALSALEFLYLSSVQGTFGTPVVATEIFYGQNATAYADKIFHYPDQDRASLSRHQADSFLVRQLIEGSFELPMNHRHAPWIFSNSIRGNITPTQPDGVNEPNTYLWTFLMADNTPNTYDETNGIDLFTSEFGDNVQDYEVQDMFTRSLSITGDPAGDDPVMCTWDWTASQITETTRTGALTAQTVQYYTPAKTKFYIDPSWANIGTTEKSCMLKSWTWTFETGFTPIFGTSGTYTYCGLAETKKMVSLELAYRRDDTNTEAEKDKYDAHTTTFIRIEMEGTTELDVGESNPPKIQLDCSARYTEWGEPSDDDGAVTETVTLESVKDPTGAKQFEALVYTDLATFP